MSGSVPRGIRVKELSDGVIYRLPRRGFGCATVSGLVMGIVGVFLCDGAAGGLLTAIVIGRKVELVAGILAAILFAAPFLALGVFLTLSGVWLMFGHTELHLAKGQIGSVLKIGILRCFIRRRAIADVQRVVLISDREQKGPILGAACAGGQPLQLAAAYPYDWPWYLGQELASRLQTERGSPAEAFELEEEWTDFTGERQVQPALSRILVEESAEGTRYSVPALRWKSLGPLLLVYFGGATAAVVLYLFISISSRQWLILLGFVPAIGFLLGAVLAARRQVYLEVRGNTLVLTRVGLFRHVQSWSRDELAAIRAVREQRKQKTSDQHGHTHTSWVWVVELQFHPINGRPVVLSGRYGMFGLVVGQEWEWLATVLRRTLDVPA
jgi:hypothetical protein